MPTEKEVRRHQRCYRVGRLMSPVLLHKYSFKTDVMKKLTEPSIILANHLTESDMFMVARAFKDPLYYVGGEHLSRNKFAPLIKYVADPILAPRGGGMLPTVMQILKRLKQGHSIAMFPEGCRSFHGETLPIPEATAKLVKKANCGLVTYKIHGGYFIAPRWAYQFRKGPASGEIVRVYSSMEIENMSIEELSENINRDLYENAYEYQSQKRYKYKAKRLAEGLENYLIICPNCGSYDTMETKKNSFRCTCCGMEGVYDEYGMLQGEKLPYHSVYDWGRWMENRFYEDLKSSEKDLLFEENEIRLYEVMDDHSTKNIAVGRLHIYHDRMEFLGDNYRREILFADISEKSLLYYGKNFLFTDKTGYYGLEGDRFHAWKLDKIYDYFKNIHN